MTIDEFYLHTKSFDETARLCKELTEKMESLKGELEEKKDELLFSWAGEGRDMFEKKYRVLSQQFCDLSDDLREISEGIYEMEQEYIQADTDLAKSLDGKQNRY